MPRLAVVGPDGAKCRAMCSRLDSRFEDELEERFVTFMRKDHLTVHMTGTAISCVAWFWHIYIFVQRGVRGQLPGGTDSTELCRSKAATFEFAYATIICVSMVAILMSLYLSSRMRKGGSALAWLPTSYVALLLLASFYGPLTVPRIEKLLGATTSCDATLLTQPGRAPNREVAYVLALVVVHLYFSVFCWMRPRTYFVVLHLTAGWYLAAQLLYGDYDVWPERKLQNATFLYTLLLMLFLCLRRTDAHNRREFLKQQRLQRLNADQAEELAEYSSKMADLAEAETLTAQQTEALERALGPGRMPESFKRLLCDFNELRLQRLLGSGNFAEVYLAEWHGTPCAVKRLHRSRMTKRGLEAFRAEVALHLTLRHPNIVSLLGCTVEPRRHGVAAILELCAKGSLEELLQADERLLTPRIKPGNVLIDDGYNPKLADFGLSREAAEEETMSNAGTPLYSAPELLRHERYDESADVWSFGCLLETLVTHRPVYHGTCSEGTKTADVANGILRPSLPDGPAFVAAILDRCVQDYPANRPRFDRLLLSLVAPDTVLAAAMLPTMGPAVPTDAASRSQPGGVETPAATASSTVQKQHIVEVSLSLEGTMHKEDDPMNRTWPGLRRSTVNI